MTRTLHSQRFAIAVIGPVRAVATGDAAKAWRADYRTLCRRAGSFVRTSGLVAFLAFLQAKGAKLPAHRELLAQLRLEWIELQLGEPTHLGNAEAMLDWTRRADLVQFMQLTRQTLRLLMWHKRFSEALIEPPAEALPSKEPGP